MKCEIQVVRLFLRGKFKDRSEHFLFFVKVSLCSSQLLHVASLPHQVVRHQEVDLLDVEMLSLVYLSAHPNHLLIALLSLLIFKYLSMHVSFSLMHCTDELWVFELLEYGHCFPQVLFDFRPLIELRVLETEQLIMQTMVLRGLSRVPV